MNSSLVIHYFINKENHNESGNGTSEVGRTDKKIGRYGRQKASSLHGRHGRRPFQRKKEAFVFLDLTKQQNEVAFQSLKIKN